VLKNKHRYGYGCGAPRCPCKGICGICIWEIRIRPAGQLLRGVSFYVSFAPTRWWRQNDNDSNKATMTETTAVAAAMATCMNERSIRGASRGERRGSHIFIVRTGCNEWPVWSGPPALGRRLGQVRRMTNTAGSTTTSSATTIKTTKTTTSSAQLVVSSSTLLSCNRKQKIHKEKIWRVTRANLEYPYKKTIFTKGNYE